MANPVIPKVWITKYALTQGIFSVENAEHCIDISLNMIATKDSGHLTIYHGKDWHRDPATAIAQAESMRRKTVMSLKSRIKKLEGLKFDAV